MKKLLPLWALLCAFGTQKAAAQPGRWYSYYDYLANSWGSVGLVTMNIWNDTTSTQHAYSSSSGDYYYKEKFTSVGMSFAPRLTDWNYTFTFPDAIIKVGPTDTFAIDSVRLFGKYRRNLLKPLVKDTLRLGFVYGDGTSTSNMPSGSVLTSYAGYVDYLGMFYDGIKNKAGNNSTAPTPYTHDIILTNTDTATFFDRTYSLPTPYVVPAGQVAGMSLSFKTGDPAWTLNDTVEYLSGAYKYGAFRPYTMCNYSSPSLYWPMYSATDSNVGYFRSAVPTGSGWAPYYIPTWAWSSGGGPTTMQYPVIDFHISCPTCRLSDDIVSGTSYPLCVPDTRAFTHPVAGGSWSSGNPAVTTVSSSGLVTGVSAGSATITYAIGTNIATQVIYVNDPNPVITGPTSVCAGNTITLSGTTGLTGSWTSSSAATATVSGGMGSAVVTGVAAGTATISFSTWSSICLLTGLGTYAVTVETLPDPGTLIGGDTVCLNATTTITPSIPGGTWSTSNANAFVSGGAVSGVAAGLSVVTYTVTNMCGTSDVQKLVNIIVCPTGVGNIENDAIITVAPNPTNDEINISGTERINSVAIYDVTGQRVFSGNYNSRSVNVSMKELPAGIYTVRVNNDKIYRVVRQ